jgi:hypothetical protein
LITLLNPGLVIVLLLAEITAAFLTANPRIIAVTDAIFAFLPYKYRSNTVSQFEAGKVLPNLRPGKSWADMRLKLMGSKIHFP